MVKFVEFERSGGRRVMVAVDHITQILEVGGNEAKTQVYFDHENYVSVVGSIDQVRAALEAGR